MLSSSVPPSMRPMRSRPSWGIKVLWHCSTLNLELVSYVYTSCPPATPSFSIPEHETSIEIGNSPSLRRELGTSMCSFVRLFSWIFWIPEWMLVTAYIVLACTIAKFGPMPVSPAHAEAHRTEAVAPGGMFPANQSEEREGEGGLDQMDHRADQRADQHWTSATVWTWPIHRWHTEMCSSNQLDTHLLPSFKYHHLMMSGQWMPCCDMSIRCCRYVFPWPISNVILFGTCWHGHKAS